MTERDIRIELLNTLLTTPHRDLQSVRPLHDEMLRTDPRFYARLAAWYADHGSVRDHKEMFVITLCLSEGEGHRDVGLALLRRLPPYEVARVVDFVKGRQVKRRTPKPNVDIGAADGAVAPSERGKAHGTHGTRGMRAEMETRAEQVGLAANVPRSMRTEIERYLREREEHPDKLDTAILHARAPLKRLYAGLHIKPSPRAQAILFAEKPPEDSALYHVKAIARAATPDEQAEAIVAHHIPYRVAVSVIARMTPTVLAALVNAMTPQEVVNNVASLKERGAFENADLKELIAAKLKAAETDKRVSAYKAKVAAEASGVTGELAERLDAITEAQVKAKGRIRRPTGLFFDKSGSMNQAIEVGRQLGAMISAICESELYTYAFDTIAYPIEPAGASLAEWERALAGISAGGGTSCGVALEVMRKKAQRVEQIILVTDEGENTAPLFKDAYTAYAAELGVRPEVVIVRIGNTADVIRKACVPLGVAPAAFDFTGDYYALTNLIPLLTHPSLLDLLMEVLEYPLPRRRPAS
jgi:hypothetical protein